VAKYQYGDRHQPALFSPIHSNSLDLENICRDIAIRVYSNRSVIFASIQAIRRCDMNPENASCLL